MPVFMHGYSGHFLSNHLIIDVECIYLVLLSTQYTLEVNVIYSFLILLSCFECDFLSLFCDKNAYLRNFITRSEWARLLLTTIEEAVLGRNKMQVLGLAAI
ncbi:hypothetical protein [Coxiella endosymbiont of Ornithodoros amblus]|uniref:hypothetical protein n=1 Tax=Coxiella endosymbiont of Ornithodoros amblus TaxID=1656166 RepID=UPI00244E1F33|nr:hypothetical protein [Coxiella endosymbiont of Ornithodoros amblus]